MKKSNASSTIDEYIATFPTNIQAILQQVRKTILKAAPKAEETIKYDMPTFVLSGNLIHFAAFKNHIGLYSIPTGDKDFQEAFSPYKTGKGSIQFPFDQPMPLALITRIVKHRIKENRDQH